MKKIIIIGTTGSGKSTLAAQLAAKLQVPHHQLDQFFWKSNWQSASDEEFFQRIKEAIDCDGWVIDGNYTRTQIITWPHADTVIWVDFPFWLTVYQCFFRSCRRALTKEELWEGTGNRESFSTLFFSRDSILLWLFQTYSKNKKMYLEKTQDPRYSHISFHRIKSRKAIKRFLDQF